MTNNIELIGIQSNKIDKSETEIIKRIIDARSQSKNKDENLHALLKGRRKINNDITKK